MNKDNEDEDKAELIPTEAYDTLFAGPIYLGYDVVEGCKRRELLTGDTRYTLVHIDGDSEESGPEVVEATDQVPKKV
jgi:hypothetical protein